MNRLAIAILATVAAFPAGYGTHSYLHDIYACGMAKFLKKGNYDERLG
jgi:hypothetical protein